MDPEQDKTDFMNWIESSFCLLEKAREEPFQAPTPQKALTNQIAVVKVLVVLEIEGQTCLC